MPLATSSPPRLAPFSAHTNMSSGFYDGNKPATSTRPSNLDDAKEQETLRPVPPAASTSGYNIAVMGDEDLSPPLPGSKVVTSTSSPGTASASTVAHPAERTATCSPPAALRKEAAATSERNQPDASARDPVGDRAAPAPERRVVGDVPEPSSSSASSSSTSHANNSAGGFRGRQQNDGRSIAPHPHGRGRGGYYSNGARRPAGGGYGRGRGRGDVNVHVHVNGNSYGNFDGGRGFGFSGGQQHRGHPRPNAHWHEPAGYRPSLHGYPRLPPPASPPFMAVPPHMPYPYMPYGPYAYSPEFAGGAAGFPLPLPHEGLPPYLPYPMYNTPTVAQQQMPQEQADAPSPAPASTEEKLKSSIRHQIEYYFSVQNLVSDVYLRQHMDDEGWVPLALIAGFRRVKDKSTDLNFIAASVLPSEEVEVKDGKIRKRTGWEKFPIKTSTAKPEGTQGN